MQTENTMHHRKKFPRKVLGNKCFMCQGEKMMGNSNAQWYGKRKHETKSIRKHPDAVREGWDSYYR